MPAIQKRGRLKSNDSKRSDGAIEIRQIIRALNKVYEATIAAGEAVHSINDDFGYNGIQGWCVNDGDGAVKFSFSRDGTVYGDSYTLRPGEYMDLNGYDIHSIKIEFISVTASYRIWQI
jgi:hypothetical protein